jgi:integrase
MTSSSPPPRRYQRTPAGLHVSEIAHPIVMGARLRLSAPTRQDLEDDRAVIEGWRREYRRSALSLDEFRNRVSRFESARSQILPFRVAWSAYVAAARPSVVSKLQSMWKCQLAPELGELPVVHLTARRLAMWESSMIAAGYAPKTTMDAFMCLAAAVRGSLKDGEELPWRLRPGKYWKPSRPPKPRKERPACITVDEVERLVHAALEEDRAQRAGTFGTKMSGRLADLGPRCATVLLLALRNGEGSGLGWDDLALDLRTPRGRVMHQAVDQWRKHHPDWTRPLDPPKRGRTRALILHPTAVKALVAHRAALEARGWFREDGAVFPGHEGGPFAGTWRNNANCIRPEDMKRLAAIAGLPFPEEWVTHSLRHSLASVESSSGADLRSIQGRTGHGTLRALEDYIHARRLPPSAIPELAVTFDAEHDTDRDLATVPDEEP